MTRENINRNLVLTALAAALLAGTACTPTVSQRGNMLEDYQIQGVTAGTHTKSDVLRLLGSPTTQSPFNENIWYYIGQETEKRGILDPKVTKERVIVVLFDEAGTVQTIHEADPSRLDIPIERDKTATHGNDMTFLQQFLGNLGRFNPQADDKPGR